MSNDRLSFFQITFLIAYAAGMAAGQILFKMAALRGSVGAPLGERVLGMVQNGYFVAAVLLYATLSFLWVWLLSFTPLSRAYVFVALAFAATPLLGGMIFAEPISVRLVIGIALIVCGLVFIAG